MIANVMGNQGQGQGDEPNKFAQWFQSEGTQVMIGGMFDAIGSLGAGMAGISPGGMDRSSMARGAQRAQGAWDRSQRRYDIKHFTKFIDSRIAEEKKKGTKADQDKIMTLQMMRRNPEDAIKASIGDNWRERLDYGYALYGQKKQDAYDLALSTAISYWDKMVGADLKRDLLNGKASAFQQLQLMPGMADYVPLLISAGGPLHNIAIQAKKEGKGNLWDTIKGWFGQGDDDKPAAGPSSYATTDTNMTTDPALGGSAPAQSFLSKPMPGLTEPDYPPTFVGGVMNLADDIGTAPYKVISGGPPGLVSDIENQMKKYGRPPSGRR
jgi:hypothetical protein